MLPCDSPRSNGTSLIRVPSRALAALVLLPRCLWSQPPVSRTDTLSVGVGDLVRITASVVSPEPMIGWVDHVAGDDLVLAETEFGSLVTVPIGAVEKLELKVARRTWTKGALAGSVIGLLAALVATMTAVEAEGNEAAAAVAGGLMGMVGAGVGACVGAGIGAVATRGGWEVIPRGRIAVGATTHGFRFGIAIGARSL